MGQMQESWQGNAINYQEPEALEDYTVGCSLTKLDTLDLLSKKYSSIRLSD